LLDHMQQRAIEVVRGMTVHEDRMRANIDLTYGALSSGMLMLTLVEEGMERDEAYRIVQRVAQQAWDEGIPMQELLAQEPATAEMDLDSVFDYERYIRYAEAIVARLDEIS
ncbi:MAG: adenylosuccinate lyase, partial [Solirubrobacterales bacterium]|nr:adenylosuccinate lyase [Solirubrobacterales bacterium]